MSKPYMTKKREKNKNKPLARYANNTIVKNEKRYFSLGGLVWTVAINSTQVSEMRYLSKEPRLQLHCSQR